MSLGQESEAFDPGVSKDPLDHCCAPFSSLAPFYRSPRLLHVEIPAPEKQSGDVSESGETNRASGPAGAEAESQPGALLRNVSARGNLPSPGVCQYD